MTKQFSWSCENGILRLFGRFDRDLLIPMWNKRIEIMQDVTLINLNAITYIDTAGIALLIHLVEIGKKRGASVTLIGLSDKMLILAQLYNLPNDALPCYFQHVASKSIKIS